MKRNAIIGAINKEREDQDLQWGGENHDHEHDTNDWIALVCKHASRAAFMALDGDGFRDQMVKVAAIAIAALEVNARNFDNAE